MATKRDKVARRLSKGEVGNRLLAALAEGNGGFCSATERLGEVEEQKHKVERRLGAIDGELTAIERSTVDEQGVATALSAFGPVWDELFQAEKERVVRLVIEGVEYDVTNGEPVIRLQDAGLAAVSREIRRSSSATI